MIAKMVISALLVFLLFGGWMLMQLWGRRFALRHPEFGRFREEGGECGKTCGCANWKKCARKKSLVNGHSSLVTSQSSLGTSDVTSHSDDPSPMTNDQ